MQAAPEPFLTAVAPSREGLVVAVEGIFPWYGLADLCAAQGMPFVLGHALSMNTLHGGQANNATSDAQKIAALLRGGMRPQASVSPAERRATRALLRRRTPLMRTRAERLSPGQHPHAHYHVPEMGKNIADKANRQGVAARCDEAAVQKTLEVALARIP
jgi:hypothetical protein